MSRTSKESACVGCGKGIRNSKGKVACCQSCRQNLTPKQKFALGVITHNSKMTCLSCGERRLFSWSTERPCCNKCRNSLSHEQKVALGIAKPRQPKKQQPWSERKPKRHVCSRCNCEFFAKYVNRVYCADCWAAVQEERKADPRRNQRKMSERRARLAGAFVEDVDPATLFERDGWRCHICGKKCRQDVDGFHPLAPTIDHLVPLARGGEHSYRNTACAHRTCNVSKGARDIGQQLALVG